jgi:hypothetical protein
MNAAVNQVAGWLADRFDEDGLPYAFGGALACIAWSVPRATGDVDVSVFVGEGELDRVFAALERAGVMVDRPAAAAEVARIGMFVSWRGRTRVDVFLELHPLHADMRLRRKAVPLDGKPRWFLSAEDSVLTKLIYYRPKDLIDLENLFAVQGRQLDVAYIEAWLRRIIPGEDPRHAVLTDLKRRFWDPDPA